MEDGALFNFFYKVIVLFVRFRLFAHHTRLFGLRRVVRLGVLGLVDVDLSLEMFNKIEKAIFRLLDLSADFFALQILVSLFHIERHRFSLEFVILHLAGGLDVGYAPLHAGAPPALASFGRHNIYLVILFLHDDAMAGPVIRRTRWHGAKLHR